MLTAMEFFGDGCAADDRVLCTDGAFKSGGLYRRDEIARFATHDAAIRAAYGATGRRKRGLISIAEEPQLDWLRTPAREGVR